MGAILANRDNDRVDKDFYPTPPNVTQSLINFLNDEVNIVTKDLTVCEPACGSGMMSDVLKQHFKTVESFDIRDTGYGKQHDFLQSKPDDCKVMITNPPFVLAEQFIIKSKEYGYEMVALLLKSQYWHSSKRLKLFNEFQPHFVLPLTWRPDFMFGSRGGAPTMEVLWTVWFNSTCNFTTYHPLSKPVDK